ncbi:hypothetical protein ACIOWK_35455, partial [Pseudomonas protegens]|uniref:hypothetical protein n=1 Tax=Pseudomonas protegens TaxID=380021 RepID=UPI00382F3BDA
GVAGAVAILENSDLLNGFYWGNFSRKGDPRTKNPAGIIGLVGAGSITAPQVAAIGPSSPPL